MCSVDNSFSAVSKTGPSILQPGHSQKVVNFRWRTGAPARPDGYVTSAFRTPTEAAFLSVFLRTSHATTRYPNSNDSTKAY